MSREFTIKFEGIELTCTAYYTPAEPHTNTQEDFYLETIRFPNGSDVDGYFTPETIERINKLAREQELKSKTQRSFQSIFETDMELIV